MNLRLEEARTQLLTKDTHIYIAGCAALFEIIKHGDTHALHTE